MKKRKRVKRTELINICDYKKDIDVELKQKRIEKHLKHLEKVKRLEFLGYKIVNNSTKNIDLEPKTIQHYKVDKYFRLENLFI